MGQSIEWKESFRLQVSKADILVYQILVGSRHAWAAPSFHDALATKEFLSNML